MRAVCEPARKIILTGVNCSSHYPSPPCANAPLLPPPPAEKCKHGPGHSPGGGGQKVCVNLERMPVPDGKSASLTAPNGSAQQVIVRNAVQDAGVTAADVGYIEAKP